MEQAETQQQQHPIGIYLWVWFLLFILSALSYMVDYIQMEGFIKYFMITLFMMLKAGLIVAVFMHMMWERLSLQSAILVPTGVIGFLMILMLLEAKYTFLTRLQYFLFD